MHRGKIPLLVTAAIALAAAALVAGCGGEPSLNVSTDMTATASSTTPARTGTTATGTTATTPAYQRQTLSFYKGLDEPRAIAWEDIVGDKDRVREDGFNIASLSPPVLITQRAGGQPRLILEGDAGSVPGLIDDMHNAGLAVFVSPTTASPGYKTQVETTEAVLNQLTDDTVGWAATAEQKQAELFTPLADYNTALGIDAGNRWSAKTLPLVRQKFTGGIVARVAADIAATPAPGAPRDFEKLDYRGYDYLMLDVAPAGNEIDQAQLLAAAADVLNRADAVVQRDGLKGVLIGFGAWRSESGGDIVDGPLLGDDGQAQVTDIFLQLVKQRIKGFFWHGWTLPGRGVKGFKVEEVLRRAFSGV